MSVTPSKPKSNNDSNEGVAPEKLRVDDKVTAASILSICDGSDVTLSTQEEEMDTAEQALEMDRENIDKHIGCCVCLATVAFNIVVPVLVYRLAAALEKVE